jgi:hypothetical protein
MNSSIMAKEQVPTHKRAPTLCALERSFLGICKKAIVQHGNCRTDRRGEALTGTLMSAPMLAPAEGAVAELALVLLLGHE